MGSELDDGDRERFIRLTEQGIPFNRFLGMRCARLERGFARLELPFREEFIGDPLRPALHGGLISTLADTCGGVAVFASSGTAAGVSTIDLRVDYLRPGRRVDLVAEARVVRQGNRVAVADIVVFHDDEPERAVATGKGVYSVRRPRDEGAEGGVGGASG